MKATGTWTSRLLFVYYVVSATYYVYYLAFVAGGISLIFSAVGFVHLQPSASSWSGLAVSTILFVTGLASWRKNVKARLFGLNPCLHIHEVEIDYTMIDERNCDYNRAVAVKAAYPVDHYKAHFHWSAQGNATGVPIEGVSKIEINTVDASFFDECFVKFDRKLNIGDKHHFKYGLTLRGGHQAVRPFLGHNVDVPLRRLRLKVSFPANFRLKCYRKQFFVNRSSELPLWEEITDCNNNIQSQAEWEIRPQKGYYYRIWWEPSQDNGAPLLPK